MNNRDNREIQGYHLTLEDINDDNSHDFLPGIEESEVTNSRAVIIAAITAILVPAGLAIHHYRSEQSKVSPHRDSSLSAPTTEESQPTPRDRQFEPR